MSLMPMFTVEDTLLRQAEFDHREAHPDVFP
jgi:hypothetical protein